MLYPLPWQSGRAPESLLLTHEPPGFIHGETQKEAGESLSNRTVKPLDLQMGI